ncbi:MAG: FG-GAP-like repeat-containing protein [Polyangia bacterium]
MSAARFARALALGVVALALVGCRVAQTPDGCASFAGQTCISLELRAPAATTLQVDQVQLSASLGFQLDEMNDFATPSTPLSIPVSLPLVVPILPGPAFGGGDFALHVRGRLGGADVGAADVSGSVAGGRHLSIAATLSSSAGENPDLADGTGDDLGGGGGDLGVVAPPRPIWPVNTGFVTTAHPLFKWELAGGDGARVDVCKDRACSAPLTSFDVAGASGTPAMALPSQVLFWRLHPMRGGALLSGVSPTWEFTRGAPTPSTVTSSWGTMLDVNGDGLADLVVGAPFAVAAASSGPGSAYLFLGDKLAKSSWKATPPAASFTLRDPGALAFDQFGTAVISAGDLDGDGYGDLAVGASCAPAVTGGCGSGRVYLYRGGPNGLSAAAPAPDATLQLANGTAQTSFGSALAAGDVDGDGYSDLVVAAAGNHAVYVFRGGPTLFASKSPPPDWTLSGPTGFAASVANAGDVDGDGYADLVVGSPQEASGRGSAYLYRGGPNNGFVAGGAPTAVTLSTGDAKANSQFGLSVAGAGDADGDGFTDVIVGADLAPDSTASPANGNGQAYAYKGAAAGINTTPIIIAHVGTGSEELGASVAGVGDVDGNGSSDVVLGAPFFSSGSAPSGSGAAFFVSGSRLDLFMAPMLQDSPPTVSAGFGGHVKFVGDLNGDGFADIAIGVPLYVSGGDPSTQPDFHRGFVAIFFGGAGGAATTPDVRILGPDHKNGQFGF